MKTENLLRIIPWVFLGFMLPAYQNCSSGLEALSPPDAEVFRSTAECMERSSGACIFDKSAMSMIGRPITAENLGGYQSHSVAIDDLDQSGYLQNADFQVVTAGTERLHRSRGFRRYYNPNSSDLEQLMAYHHANLLRKWLRSHEEFSSTGLAVRIVVDSSFNGWVPSKNEIHLERDGVRFPAALDGSLIVSLYAHSEIWAASGGDSHNRLSTKTVTCSDASLFRSPSQCCASALGCGPALVSGAADFMVARIFERQGGVIGDGWKNNPAGQSLCGVVRDATKTASLDASGAYALCSGRGAGGLIPAMGLVYASIWWEARKAVPSSERASFEKFFLRHLKLIQGDDDFSTMKAKLLSLDSTEFGGRFGDPLSREFSRRGL